MKGRARNTLQCNKTRAGGLKNIFKLFLEGVVVTICDFNGRARTSLHVKGRVQQMRPQGRARPRPLGRRRLRAPPGSEQRVLYSQPAGPNPLYHRDC